MKKYNEINLGDTAQIIHIITEKDIDKFVDLTGDNNKLHINKDFAEMTEFKNPVVHGMIGASFISTLIGTKLPGDGALWYSQTLDFLRPVRVGDTISVEAIVINKIDKSNAIELKIEIFNQFRQIVTSGISKVKVIEVETKAKVKEEREIKKTVLLIGASGGIGSATALKLAQEGFDLILHYNTNKDVVDKIQNDVIKLGSKAIVVKANLLIPEDISKLIHTVKSTFDSISGFVNCSSISIPTIKFENLEWNILQSHFEINVKSTFYILKALLPIFKSQKYGKIVLLTSQSIETPSTDWVHYITAKSALNGFVKSLAIEYGQYGININMISPSLIDTNLTSEIPKKIKLYTEAKTPLRRLCHPVDISEAIFFLLSDKSSFITGETLRINGGQVML
jgi:3-oxoacyl-[acyl-carrier protein] reductase